MPRGTRLRAAVAGSLLGLVVVAPPSAARQKAARATTSTEPAVAKDSLDPKQLAAAVRSAALGPATAIGAVLGAPACPSGAKKKPGTVVQCIVGFDATPVPYLVKLDADGSLRASPTFLVLSRVGVETLAAGLVGAPVRCGTGHVLVVPGGSEFDCTSAKKGVTLRAGADGAISLVGTGRATTTLEPTTTVRRRH